MFLFVVGEILCCGAVGISASIHIIRKPLEFVQMNLNSNTVGDSYCRQKLVKEEGIIFVKTNPEHNHHIGIKYHCNEHDIKCSATGIKIM
jgi:hypothetical protein